MKHSGVFIISAILTVLFIVCRKKQKKEMKEGFLFKNIGNSISQNMKETQQRIQAQIEATKERMEEIVEAQKKRTEALYAEQCSLLDTSGFRNKNEITSGFEKTKDETVEFNSLLLLENVKNNIEKTKDETVEFNSPLLFENDENNIVKFGSSQTGHEPVFTKSIKMNDNVDIHKTIMLNSEAKICMGNTCLTKQPMTDSDLDLDSAKHALKKLQYIKDRETAYLTRNIADYKSPIKYPADYSNKTKCGALLWDAIKIGNDVKQNMFCDTCCKPKYIAPIHIKRAQVVIIVSGIDEPFKVDVNDYDKPIMYKDMEASIAYKVRRHDFHYKIFLSRTHKDVKCRLLLTDNTKARDEFLKSDFETSIRFSGKVFKSNTHMWCTNSSFSTTSAVSDGYCIPSTLFELSNIKYKYVCLKYN